MRVFPWITFVLLLCGTALAESPAVPEQLQISIQLSELTPSHDGAQPQTISAPRLVVAAGQRAQASIGQQIIVPSLFDKELKAIETGVHIDILADSVQDGKTAVDIFMRLSEPVVNEEEELEVVERSTRIIKRFELGKSHRIRLPQSQKGTLLFADVTFSRVVPK